MKQKSGDNERLSVKDWVYAAIRHDEVPVVFPSARIAASGIRCQCLGVGNNASFDRDHRAAPVAN